MCLICDRIKMIQDGNNPYFVKELSSGYVVLGDHQHFRGYTLFLCKQHVTELFYLDKDFATTYMQEMMLVAEAVKKAFHADKINYECLGQGDAHVHWHIFPRVAGDIENYGNNGVGPVWWYPRERMYSEEALVDMPTLEQLKKSLACELNKLSSQ